MSIEAVKAFVEKVKGDSDLRETLLAIGPEDGDTALAEIVRIASEAGFSFSPEDYKAAALEMAEARHAAGELSDEALDAVAGGHELIKNDSYSLICPPETSSYDEGSLASGSCETLKQPITG